MISKKCTYESSHRVFKDPVKYNILLVGASGTGKSSVINMIFNKTYVKTSFHAIGCTDKCSSICASPTDYSEVNLRLVDTVGLSESLEDTVSSKKAINMLEKQLNSLYSEDGIHLILFCIRKGRQSQATNEHYDIIVRDLCENQVPCLLVITWCEDDEPLGEWWQNNKIILCNQLNLDVRDAVAVTTVKNQKTLVIYNESRKRLIEAIKKYALKEPWRSRNFREKLGSILHYRSFGISKISQRRSDSINDYLQRPMEPSGMVQTIWNSIFSRQS